MAVGRAHGCGPFAPVLQGGRLKCREAFRLAESVNGLNGGDADLPGQCLPQGARVKVGHNLQAKEDGISVGDGRESLLLMGHLKAKLPVEGDLGSEMGRKGID